MSNYAGAEKSVILKRDTEEERIAEDKRSEKA